MAAVHGAFEWGGIFIGVRLYLRAGRISLAELGRTRHFAVVLGCVLGAALGNKAVHWIHHAERWPMLVDAPWLVLQGQSIVGGLLGGLIGVEVGKRIAGVKESTGDRFVLPILVGLSVGRIGCFIAGLQDDTFGNPTTMPWGVDFGDGIARHPTQLYECAFVLALGLLLRANERRFPRAGDRFRWYMIAYLMFRFAIEFIKPIPQEYVFGLSGIQLLCLAGLIHYHRAIADLRTALAWERR